MITITIKGSITQSVEWRTVNNIDAFSVSRPKFLSFERNSQFKVTN